MAVDLPLQDAFGRTVRYVRLSVTDRCNLRCAYCMPDGCAGIERPRDLLTYEELRTVAEAFVRCGVRKFRLTGGEPLVRKDLHVLVSYLSGFAAVQDVALSTNGVLLAGQARRLKEAGLRRVNVSLDTLRPETFARLSAHRGLANVLDGIAAAEAAGLAPIKLNCVVMRGVNDDEVGELARLTLAKPWTVRFVEVMPMRHNPDRHRAWYVPASEIRARIEAEFGPLIEDGPEIEALAAWRQTEAPVAWRGIEAPAAGPARTYRIVGARGRLGLIAPVSHSFCPACNRVRLTPAGTLRLCLFGEAGTDLRGPLRRGATAEDLEAIIRAALARKPASHELARGHGGAQAPAAMSRVGG